MWGRKHVMRRQRGRKRHCAAEALERRMLLSLSTAGVEFRVNTTTAKEQSTAAVAMDAAGDFVVAWSSYVNPASSWGIFAQRFDAAGNPRGAEFRANTQDPNQQVIPSIAMDASGDFVIAW